jgi:AcrR family transcriptional regulator
MDSFMRRSFLLTSNIVFIAGREQKARKAATPRRALEQLRDSQSQQTEALRAQVQEATLVVCGELGYREVAVQDVLERSGCSRVRFYRLFGGKADCYARAYATEAERVCEALLDAARAAESWRAGLRVALSELSRFVCEQPLLAKGLFVEVHSAGGPALAKHTEMIERLSRAFDGARRENESRHSPPPIAAEFMVCAIEESVVTALAKGTPDSFADAVPELAFFAVAPFFGAEAAHEDMAVMRAA